MTNLFCVRAEFGTYTKQFVEGGYVAIGWMSNTDLSAVKSRDSLYPLYKQAHPDDTSNIVIGQQVGQIARFLLEIAAGDYVITPAADTEWLHHGEVAPEPSYVYAAGDDGCPYRHRRRVVWARERLKRGDFSVPFQNTIRSSLTVFAVSQRDEFLAAIGRADLAPKPVAAQYDPYRVVLEQVLELDDKEFEILVGHLLPALGFEGSEVTGKTGGGGRGAGARLPAHRPDPRSPARRSADRALGRHPAGVSGAPGAEAGAGAHVSQFSESVVEQSALVWLEGAVSFARPCLALRSAGQPSSDQPDPEVAFSRHLIWRLAGRGRVTQKIAA